MKQVTITNNCKTCGRELKSQFTVDSAKPGEPHNTEWFVKDAIEKQKKHIKSLHPGHDYSLVVA